MQSIYAYNGFKGFLKVLIVDMIVARSCTTVISFFTRYSGSTLMKTSSVHSTVLHMYGGVINVSLRSVSLDNQLNCLPSNKSLNFVQQTGTS